MAVTAYELANLPELLPRGPKREPEAVPTAAESASGGRDELRRRLAGVRSAWGQLVTVQVVSNPPRVL